MWANVRRGLRILLFFVAFMLASCATPPLIENISSPKKPRLGILKFKIVAPIHKLSSVKETSPKNLNSSEESQLETYLSQVENKATNELKNSLEKNGKIEPVIIPDGFAGLKRGEKPTASQIEQIKKEFAVDAVFYGEIPWYGKTRLLYPILFESLDITAESIALGLLTHWNGALIVANIGFELLTSTPLWFGGTYVLGWAFRPVSIDGYVFSSSDGLQIWNKSVDQVSSREELKKYPEEDRKKKEVQLEVSLNNAIHSLTNAMTGEPEPHFASVGVMLGQASLNNGGKTIATYGLSTSLTLDPHWQLGAQFNLTSPQTNFQSITNFDTAIKYAEGSWNAGILLGVNLTESSTDDSESINFNCGLTAGYDWIIPKTDFSIGPQFDFLWSPMMGGYTDFNTMAEIGRAHV